MAYKFTATTAGIQVYGPDGQYGIFPDKEAAQNQVAEWKRLARNQARRDRHAALVSLGLKRVKGALGGIYYE